MKLVLTIFSTLAILPITLFSLGRGEMESAEMEALRSHIADCTLPYFPDAPAASPSRGPFAYASRAREAAYPSVSLASGTLYDATSPEDAPNIRREIFETEDAVYASTIHSDTLCTRLIIRVSPREIGIARLTTTVGLNIATEPVFFRKGVQSVTIPGTEADTAVISAWVFEGGDPAPGREVRLWADWRGIPPSGRGRSVAHEHLYSNPQSASTSLEVGARNTEGFIEPGTIRIRNQNGAVTVRTDNMGVAFGAAVPQYRGGTESVMGSTRLGDRIETVTAPVVLTVLPRLVHFAEYFNRNADAMTPSEDFPFRMVGDTDDHKFNHFISSAHGDYISRVFQEIRARDIRQRPHLFPNNGENRWVQLNDMSLEYGGQFKIERAVGVTQCNVASNDGSHKSHVEGLDFDLNPCYTTSDGLRIGAGTCWQVYPRGGTDQFPLISRTLIEEYIVGTGIGLVHVHPHSGGDSHHYHIRFNPEGFR